MTHNKLELTKKQDVEKIKDKKIRNERFQKLIKGLVSEPYFWLIEECGTFLSFAVDETETKRKLYRANFCKHRFCPMCAWKKARKDALGLSLMMQDIQLQDDKAFIFLTLTMPNVTSEQLEDTIKLYNSSFKKLLKRDSVKNVVKGYVRKLEITYNQKRDDYHPHFHVLIAVNKSYFKESSVYISQKQWLELWRDVTCNFKITQVDVRRVKEQNNQELYEMAKYSGKDSDYLTNRTVFESYYKALKGKRVLAYGGLFKTARQKLKNGDLDYLREMDPAKYIYQIFLGWRKGEYYESELRLLDEQEKTQLNHQMIDEIECEG